MAEIAILGLDTATRATVAAVQVGSQEGFEHRHDPLPGERPGHAQRLLGLAAAALEDAGLQWGDVGLIAAGVGPGTFTGLRIGLATARALAQSSGAPLVGVSTLRALAAGAAQQSQPVAAVLDARRREAFAAAYAGEQELVAPMAIAPEELGERLALVTGAGALAIGEGAIKFRSRLEAAGLEVPGDDSPLHLVSGLAVCRLARTASPVGRDGLLPDYQRLPDAEIARRSQ